MATKKAKTRKKAEVQEKDVAPAPHLEDMIFYLKLLRGRAIKELNGFVDNLIEMVMALTAEQTKGGIGVSNISEKTISKYRYELKSGLIRMISGVSRFSLFSMTKGMKDALIETKQIDGSAVLNELLDQEEQKARKSKERK